MPLKCETNMLQDPTEFSQFLAFIHKHDVRSYLEIGSKHGGSLWRISNAMPRGSKVVAVDLPQGDGSFKASRPNLIACVDELKKRGYEASLILGDSTDPTIVEKVRKRSPFDLCFIDACHLEPYVWRDWHNYGEMAKFVAFHDISHIDKSQTKPGKMPIQVMNVWKKLRAEYKHTEICCCPAVNGIGILWKSYPTSSIA